MASCAAEQAASRRPPLELADIVRACGEAFGRGRALRPEQATVLRAIVRCRTAALGGHLHVCVRCGHEQPRYNSCRNRHCPKCQALAQAKWIAQREARILPTSHFHVVFTIPSELHALARYRREQLFDLLFSSAARTLIDLGRERLGALVGATMVLHTWTRDLRFHPHVHAIVTAGGLSEDGILWIPTPKDYFMPVKLMGAVLRDRFLRGLRRLQHKGAFAGFADFADPEGFDRLVARVASKSWVVYAKRPFGQARQVLRYLGRYTHRVGLSNRRLVSLSADRQVTFRTKEGKKVTLPGEQFLDRFVQHVLPKHYVKIRHAGLLASSNVSTKLARARELLAPALPAPAPSRAAMSWQDVLLALAAIDVRICPHCGGTIVARPLPPAAFPPPLPPDTS